MERPTLLSDLLEALGVPHTRAYSDMRFRQMTFKSLFGLSKVLEEYGVESRALALGDKKADLKLLTMPFLAASTDGFAIVYGIDGETVDLSLPTGAEKMPLATFLDRWTGTVLLLSPHEHAHEPDLGKHRFYDYAAVAKRWILGVAMAFFLLHSLFSQRYMRKGQHDPACRYRCGGTFRHLSSSSEIAQRPFRYRRPYMRHNRPYGVFDGAEDKRVDVFRDFQLERGRRGIFQCKPSCSSSVSRIYRLSGSYQCLLLSFFGVERLVPEVSC